MVGSRVVTGAVLWNDAFLAANSVCSGTEGVFCGLNGLPAGGFVKQVTNELLKYSYNFKYR